jgi:hypothetical protein
MARAYGKMPHELLHLGIDEFNFSLAVMHYAAHGEERKQPQGDYIEMKPDEFMKLFPGA